jgi:hypothetical protein
MTKTSESLRQSATAAYCKDFSDTQNAIPLKDRYPALIRQFLNEAGEFGYFENAIDLTG